jgi:hypothetical protein
VEALKAGFARNGWVFAYDLVFFSQGVLLQGEGEKIF